MANGAPSVTWEEFNRVRDQVRESVHDIEGLEATDERMRGKLERLEEKLDTLTKWMLSAVVTFSVATIALVANIIIALSGGS